MHSDKIAHDIEEDFLVDVSVLHYAQVQVKYHTQELTRKGKVVRGVARMRRIEDTARRSTFKNNLANAA